MECPWWKPWKRTCFTKNWESSHILRYSKWVFRGFVLFQFCNSALGDILGFLNHKISFVFAIHKMPRIFANMKHFCFFQNTANFTVYIIPLKRYLLLFLYYFCSLVCAFCVLLLAGEMVNGLQNYILFGQIIVLGIARTWNSALYVTVLTKIVGIFMELSFISFFSSLCNIFWAIVL